MIYETHRAAKLLKIHPVELIHHLASLEVSFNDIWPNVDEALIDTIKNHLSEKAKNKTKDKQTTTKFDNDTPTSLGISRNACLIIVALGDKGKWGYSSANFDFIRSITGLSREEIERSIEELKAKSFIKLGEYNSYSLNTEKTGEINRIIHESRG